jgi:hypothetical protein
LDFQNIVAFDITVLLPWRIPFCCGELPPLFRARTGLTAVPGNLLSWSSVVVPVTFRSESTLSDSSEYFHEEYRTGDGTEGGGMPPPLWLPHLRAIIVKRKPGNIIVMFQLVSLDNGMVINYQP